MELGSRGAEPELVSLGNALSSAAAALEAVVAARFPRARLGSSRNWLSPHPGFTCELEAEEPITAGDLDALARAMRERLAQPAAFALVAARRQAEATSSGAGRWRIDGVAHLDPRRLRFFVAVHDRAEELHHRNLGAELALFARRLDDSGQVRWLPRGTVVLGLLEEAVRRFLSAEGYCEASAAAYGHPRVYELSRARASERPHPAERIDSYLADLADLRAARGALEDHERVRVTADCVASEVERWGEAVERFYRALGVARVFREEADSDGGRRIAYLSRDLLGEPRHPAGALTVPAVGSTAGFLELESRFTASVESLLAAILEETGGDLPLWLAPVQIRVVPITYLARSAAEHVRAACEAKGLRCEVDLSEESWEHKLRRASDERAPYFLVLGNREARDGTVDLRTRAEPRRATTVPLADFVQRVVREAEPPYHFALA
jgi:hypothetical protein